jgi:hypothetical protein
MRTEWKNVSAVLKTIFCLVKSNLALRSRLRLNYEGRNLRSRLNYGGRNSRSRLDLRLRLRFKVKVKIET